MPDPPGHRRPLGSGRPASAQAGAEHTRPRTRPTSASPPRRHARRPGWPLGTGLAGPAESTVPGGQPAPGRHDPFVLAPQRLAGCTTGGRAAPTCATTTGNVRVPAGVATRRPTADLTRPEASEGHAHRLAPRRGLRRRGQGPARLPRQALAGQGYPGMAIQYRLSRGRLMVPGHDARGSGPAGCRRQTPSTTPMPRWRGCGPRRRPTTASGRTALVLAGYSAGGITAATTAAAGERPDRADRRRRVARRCRHRARPPHGGRPPCS